MVALVAVFVLLVQAMLPSLAMAAPVRLGEQVICTSHGLKVVAAGDTAPAQQTPAGPCDHCVCPPSVALAAPTVQAAQPVRFAAEASPPTIARAERWPPARAPPRPPGQGPPAPNA